MQCVERVDKGRLVVSSAGCLAHGGCCKLVVEMVWLALGGIILSLVAEISGPLRTGSMAFEGIL